MNTPTWLTMNGRGHGKTLAVARELERHRRDLLAYLRTIKRRLNSERRGIIAREREHVRGLDHAGLVEYLNTRARSLGFEVRR